MFRKWMLGLAGVLGFATAFAQTAYPSKQVRLIVPFATGGGTDMTARLFAQKMSEAWGQTVVVENRPGADGIIGSEAAARAAPDGYTLLIVTPSHTTAPVLRASMPYDTVKAFTPITALASTPFVAVVGNHVPAKTVRELVDYMKAHPGKVSFGSADPSSRLAGELFRSLAGVDMQNVPYKGGAAIFSDVVGGHLPVGFASLMSALPFQKAGTAKVIGVSTTTRSPLAPEIPTLSEAGLQGYDMAAWYGIVAPANTPVEIVNRIQQTVARIAAMPDVKASLLRGGATPIADTPAEFSAFIERELARNKKIAAAAGIRPE